MSAGGMDFGEAVAKAKELKVRPTDEELLELYGFYKQAVVGDNTIGKPWIDVSARAKWESWEKRKGLSSEEAKKLYVQVVQKLIEKYEKCLVNKFPGAAVLYGKIFETNSIVYSLIPSVHYVYYGARELKSLLLFEAVVFPKSVQPYLRLMRIDKPTGFWLLYWPCTWSIALAAPPASLPDLKMLALFGGGSVLMRSAGCIINDIFDKDYDKMVERTRSRPLASGELTNRQAVALLAVLLSGSLSILLQFSWFSVVVGASSLFLVVAYPLAKRYTYWPQFVLGLTSNWGVLIAWCHLCPNTLLTVIPLYTATVLYTATYDTIYSQQWFYGLLVRFVKFTYEENKQAGEMGYGSRIGIQLGRTAGMGRYTRRIVHVSGIFTLYGFAELDSDLRHNIRSSGGIGLDCSAHMFTNKGTDRTDDLIAGVKSTALLFGDKTKYWLTGFAAVTLLGLGTTGIIMQQTWPFYAALAATGTHLAWQIGTVNTNDPNDCWKKFKTNQAVSDTDAETIEQS
uniref:4-hydroxybenzoate polyprenyltransferase, mitochondrial n=1 Tax=Setaria digitata TaxID=48799 RepID=A0A915PH79_9BILA